MKYVLEYRESPNEKWKTSNVAGKEYNSIQALLRDVHETGYKGVGPAIATLLDYRIRKIPEQPEEQVLE